MGDSLAAGGEGRPVAAQALLAAAGLSAPRWPVTEAARAGWLGAFYGKPDWAVPNRSRLCGYAALAAGHAATLAASEVALGCGGSGRGRFVQEQLGRNALPGLRNAVQLAAAGGWVALKPFVRGGEILCDVVSADSFVPLAMAGGEVLDAAFIDHAEVGGTAYARLEVQQQETNGLRVRNLAFRLEEGRRPEAVPLANVPAWEGLGEEVLVAGAPQGLFAVLRMPFANTVEAGCPLPVSLYAGAMESLRGMDSIYTEFLWEVESGHRRQILDIPAAQTMPGAGGRVDAATDDLYLVLDMGGAAAKPWDDYTPELRIGQYQAAMDMQLRLLERQCGLSAGTFAFELRTGLAGPRTAAEVASDDRETFHTVSAIQQGGLRRGLLDLVRVYDTLAGLYRLAPAGKLCPTVGFGDSVFEDVGSEFARRKALADGGYLAPEQLTGWYFDLPAEQARALLPTGPGNGR